MVHTCRKNRGWLPLADVIELILYLCNTFVPYFSLLNIHSHSPEGENLRFLREPGYNVAPKTLTEEWREISFII